MKTDVKNVHITRKSDKEISRKNLESELKRKTICLVVGHKKDIHLSEEGGDVQYCSRCNSFYSTSEPRLKDSFRDANYQKARRPYSI